MTRLWYNLEQGLFATAVRNLGAGLQPPLHDPQRITADLDRVLSPSEFAEAARRFAARYAGFDAINENDQMVARLEELTRS